jgi:hypothetical protein
LFLEEYNIKRCKFFDKKNNKKNIKNLLKTLEKWGKVWYKILRVVESGKLWNKVENLEVM